MAKMMVGALKSKGDGDDAKCIKLMSFKWFKILDKEKLQIIYHHVLCIIGYLFLYLDKILWLKKFIVMKKLNFVT